MPGCSKISVDWTKDRRQDSDADDPAVELPTPLSEPFVVDVDGRHQLVGIPDVEQSQAALRERNADVDQVAIHVREPQCRIMDSLPALDQLAVEARRIEASPLDLQVVPGIIAP